MSYLRLHHQSCHGRAPFKALCHSSARNDNGNGNRNSSSGSSGSTCSGRRTNPNHSGGSAATR